MKIRSLAPSVTGLLAFLCITAGFQLHAAAAGSDDASQAAYKPDDGNPSNDADPKNNTNGWISGDNGGSGFKGWNLVASESKGSRGFFIGDSKGLAGGAGGDINTNGLSFGLFGKGEGNRAEAYRSFDAPLTAGQSFSISLAVNFRNGQKGLDLRDASDSVVFNFNIGGDDYVVNQAATGNGSIGSEYNNNTVFKLVFTQTSAAGGNWTITREGALKSSAKGTYRGAAAGIKLYVMGTDDGSENDLMANSLTLADGSAGH